MVNPQYLFGAVLIFLNIMKWIFHYGRLKVDAQIFLLPFFCTHFYISDRSIEKELGRGRFGITYLVKNKNGDRQVIKTLNDDLLNSLNQLERERLKTMFLQEALKLQMMNKKNIILGRRVTIHSKVK